MSAYLPIVKQWHIAFALLSLSGFIFRGMVMLRAPQRMQNPWLKRLPHVIDSGLFSLGIVLLWFGPWSLWSAPWLQAKLSALLYRPTSWAFSPAHTPCCVARGPCRFCLHAGSGAFEAGLVLVSHTCRKRGMVPA
jgi:hypothetical protein